MPISFALSPLQLCGCIAVTFAAVALSYLLGLNEGRERLRRQLRQQAREDGPESLGILVGGHRDE